MKVITLIRHAKSSWKHSGLRDYDRPLNKRGRHDAPMMGERLARRGFDPDCFISSTALRALRTAEAIATAVGFDHRRLQVEPQVYGAHEQDLVGLIQNLSPRDHWVAIVGHNPEMTLLTSRLSGTRIDNVPTCGVAEVHYQAGRWDQVGSKDLRPVDFSFDYPKNQWPA